MHENCVPREEFDRVVSQLRAENEVLRVRVRELEALLERFVGPHAPPSTREVRYPRREPTGNPVGKPKGAPGATRKLEHRKPDETKQIKPEKCRRCRHKLGEPVGWVKQFVEEIPEPQPTRLIEFQKGICICPSCGAENVATDSRCPTSGEIGPRALALAQELRFRERLSVVMARRVLRERYGLKVSSGAVLDMTSRTARMLRGAQNALVMRVRGSKTVYVDETGFYINGVRVWLWIFTTERDALVVIERSRASKVPRRILGEHYAGTIVCDCYSAYDLLKKRLQKAKFQKCWAHLLREAKACAQHFEEGRALYTELCAFYGGMSGFLKEAPQPDIRDTEFRAALAWLDRLLANEPKEPRVVRLLKRLRKHREDWFTCIAVPNVEPTNNRAERGLRPQVILRRLRGSLRSERGKEDHQVVTSLMASWELQGMDPTLQLENELCEVFSQGGPM